MQLINNESFSLTVNTTTYALVDKVNVRTVIVDKQNNIAVMLFDITMMYVLKRINITLYRKCVSDLIDEVSQ